MNLLFICSRNQWRSPTAEKIFHGINGVNAKSAGTSPSARIRVNEKHLQWADYVFVMENKHKSILQERWPDLSRDIQLIVLDIPDEYQYMDEELIEQLQSAVAQYINV